MPKSKKAVLIVDDDTDVAYLISRILSREGYRILISFRMEDAITGFTSNLFEVAIVDIFMRGMGGIAGIAKMRELRPDAKIIAVSGGYVSMSKEDALRAARKVGADAVLPKPFENNQLKKLVGDLVYEAAAR